MNGDSHAYASPAVSALNCRSFFPLASRPDVLELTGFLQFAAVANPDTHRPSRRNLTLADAIAIQDAKAFVPFFNISCRNRPTRRGFDVPIHWLVTTTQ